MDWNEELQLSVKRMELGLAIDGLELLRKKLQKRTGWHEHEMASALANVDALEARFRSKLNGGGEV